MTNVNEIYVTKVIAEVKELLGDGFEVERNDVTKNNNITFTGITIKEDGSDIYPNIYIDNIIEANLSVADAAKTVVEIFDKNKMMSNVKTNEITEIFRNEDKLLSMVKPKLVGANQADDVITYPFLDLKVAFYVTVAEGEYGAKGNITLRKGQTSIDPATLYKRAISNMEKIKVVSMIDMLARMGCPVGLLDTDEIPMDVITSESQMFGAVGMLKTEIFEELSDKYDDNVIILPSSIHELIAVPASDCEGNPMVDMVRTVNSNVVSPEEVLSDNVYIYNKETKNIEIRRED